jgi:hypothetical protein
VPSLTSQKPDRIEQRRRKDAKICSHKEAQNGNNEFEQEAAEEAEVRSFFSEDLRHLCQLLLKGLPPVTS